MKTMRKTKEEIRKGLERAAGDATGLISKAQVIHGYMGFDEHSKGPREDLKNVRKYRGKLLITDVVDVIYDRLECQE